MRLLWMIGAALLMAACSGREPAKDTGRDVARGAMPGDSVEGRGGTPGVLRGSTREALSDDVSVPVVLIVGTSLTAGLGLDPDDAYPALLQRKADSAGFVVRVVNAGLSGETSAGALRRIDWLLQERVDVVVVETGANDGLRGLDIDGTRANLHGILQKIRREKPEAQRYLVQMEAPPNLGADYTTRFHEMFPAVAREEGATLVPFLLDGVAAVPELNQGDGIHPNEEGARVVAENMWRALGREIARIGSRE